MLFWYLSWSITGEEKEVERVGLEEITYYGSFNNCFTIENWTGEFAAN